MRIGEVARQVGVSPDTVRFYERAGALPAVGRQDNRYRDYREADVEHLRLLVELRRLGVTLEDAARVASWCHAGHCATTTDALPALIRKRRSDIAARVAALLALDTRLAGLESHLGNRRILALATDGACCESANAIIGAGSCCAPADPG
ncbi:MAG TPA: MerR family transcriptional regulator [Candidatus Limnocylindrales bacterium]|nr:MerR family transcriptional regulator [Candidatus Limnocylindrales bacterium]